MQLRTPRIDFPIASRRRQTPLLVRRRLIEMGPKSGVDDRILKPRDIWSDSEAYGAAFYREIRFPRITVVTWSAPKSVGTKVWTASRSSSLAS